MREVKPSARAAFFKILSHPGLYAVLEQENLYRLVGLGL